MNQRKIGALIIGQSPRSDLVSPLVQKLPQDCLVIEAGALDDLNSVKLPPIKGNSYLLETRLSDGTPVMVGEDYLTPKLQTRLDYLEKQGVTATILLCAGTFQDLQGRRPLLKPFNLGRQLLQSLDFKKIGLITPIQEQETPIRRRWTAAGFQVSVWTADLNHQDKQFSEDLRKRIKENSLQAVVLDYVGYPLPVVKQLQGLSPIPVFDLGHLAIGTLVTLFERGDQ